MGINGAGSVFEREGMWLIGNDSSYGGIDKKIGKSVLFFKSKTVIAL